LSSQAIAATIPDAITAKAIVLVKSFLASSSQSIRLRYVEAASFVLTWIKLEVFTRLIT